MPENNISIPTKGLNRDLHNINKSSENYSFALNATLKNEVGNSFILQNDESNILKTTFPIGYKVIGFKYIVEQDRTLFFLINPITNANEIGEVKTCVYFDSTDSEVDCDNCNNYNKEQKPLEQTTQIPFCNYRTIISCDCLNLNMDYPVNIEYKITNCGINIYFTDNLNQRRFLQFEYSNGLNSGDLIVKNNFLEVGSYTTDEGGCITPNYLNKLDCNTIPYHPNYSKPCIDFVDTIFGGSNKAGVYQFMIQYADAKGNALTECFAASNPIPLQSRPITIDTIYPTDKSIVIDIKNLETEDFQYYNLIVVETLDNFTEFKLIGTFSTLNGLNNNTVRYTYSGDEKSLIKLSANDIIYRRPYYLKAANVTKSNNYLFFSGLSSQRKLNLQRAANKVQLLWETVELTEDAYLHPFNCTNYKSFLRDEVYALGIVYTFSWGEETDIFHIPAPTKQYFFNTFEIDVDTIISNNDVISTPQDCSGDTYNKLWQVYNTAQVLTTPHNTFKNNCSLQDTWETGCFAYWESTDKYPNNYEIWGELCNQPIRHHKFPDCLVSSIHDGKDNFGISGASDYQQHNKIYPIGVKVNEQSVRDGLDYLVTQGIITQYERNNIVGYRIVRGNRASHKSIIAKGLLFDMWSYNKFGNTYFYPNYPYNDINDDIFIDSDKSVYSLANDISAPASNTGKYNVFSNTGRYTFHSPNTHFVNPSLGNIIKLETNEFGITEGYFTEAQLEAKYKLLSAFAFALAFGVGLAYAFSLKDQECRTYTTKSDYKGTEDAYTVSGSASSTQVPYNIAGALAGSSAGAINLVVTPTPISTSSSANVPIITSTETHNNSTFTPYDKSSGNLTTAVDVDNVTYNTCTGKPYQQMYSTNTVGAALFSFGATQDTYILIQAIKEMQLFLEAIKAVIPLKNFAIQYNSVGKYNCFTNLANNTGEKIRLLNGAFYLDSNVNLVTEFNGSTYSDIFVNNNNRESSVYLSVNPTLFNIATPVTDNSRIDMDSSGLSYTDLNKKVYAKASSYYSSIMNRIPNQYGAISQVEYIEMSPCNYKISDVTTNPVFGGDTFINRFAVKRKMPFFTQTRFKFPNESDVNYSELGNVGFPNHFFDSDKTFFEKLESATFSLSGLAALVTSILGVASSRLDARVTSLFYQKGYVHVYNYGIPYFICESDVNVDLRHGENVTDKDFYPHQQNLDFWLQEKNTPIERDNTFYYNKTYSKQNKESFLLTSTFSKGDDDLCKAIYNNRLIYSEQSNSDNFFDNWLIFKANSYYDFPLTDGKLIASDGIENDKVLVRLENTAKIFNAYNLLQTDSTNIQVETGGMFKSKPIEFVNSTLGYAGSQHRALLNTEFGHIYIDAKRGSVINIGLSGSGVDEINNNGMYSWFKENLPFTLSKYFPKLTPEKLDNTFKNVGISLGFDKKYNRLFVTKLDYQPKLNKGIIYDDTSNKFLIPSSTKFLEVQLTDNNYFINKSWTISYDFIKKTWVSYHSFIQNFYINKISSFETVNQMSTSTQAWLHNATNKSYQVYNGKLYPFILEFNTQPSGNSSILNSLEYSLDVIRYQNDYDYFYNREINFNKAIIYNERQNTGILELINRNENDLSQHIDYPISTNSSTQILCTNSENSWKLSDLYDSTKSQLNNIPIWKNDSNNTDKQINPIAIQYSTNIFDRNRLRGTMFTAKMINDKYSNYKFIFQFSKNSQTLSLR